MNGRSGSFQPGGRARSVALRKIQYCRIVVSYLEIEKVGTSTRCSGPSAGCPRSLPMGYIPPGIDTMDSSRVWDSTSIKICRSSPSPDTRSRIAQRTGAAISRPRSGGDPGMDHQESFWPTRESTGPRTTPANTHFKAPRRWPGRRPATHSSLGPMGNTFHEK